MGCYELFDRVPSVVAGHDQLENSIRNRSVLLDGRPEQQAELAQSESDAAEVTLTRAQVYLDTARAALGAARQSALSANEATLKVAALSEALERLEREAGNAAEHALAADQLLKAATDGLDSVRRAAAAAHAASASHVGDPCPICKRTLPKGFVAPTAPGETEAERAREAAVNEARDTNREAAVAATNRDNGRRALDDVTGIAEQANRDVLVLAAEASRRLNVPDLNGDDEELLAASLLVVEKASSAVSVTRGTAQAKRAEATAAAAELRPTDEALTTREKGLSSALRTLERREAHSRTAIEGVPPAFRPEPCIVEACVEQLGRIELNQRALFKTAEDLNTARADLAPLRVAQNALHARGRDEIDRPVEQLCRRVEHLADRATEAAAILGQPPPPHRPEGSLVDDATWAEAVIENAAALAQGSTQLADAETTSANGSDADIASALAEIGVEDDSELEDRLIATSAAVRVAQADLLIAESQMTVVADLDSRIEIASPFLNTLDELGRLLADGKFLGAVVKRKQRALLGVASELLAEMTARRFGFAEAFQIVDRLSGQPRDVKTLSGGETFVASLALALALVELAGRGGGRLEALFLDEGFGSLDANSLADALDALGRQAQGGRLVAVISHLHAVAENIEHVLLVTKGSGGSEAHWAKTSERDQLLSDEFQVGLLT